ncbi:MAG: hypothetical protein C4289_06265 [Chloroflexota bacterium]
METDSTRAVLVPPARLELLLASPAPQVGRIVALSDGSETWPQAGAGTDIPMADIVGQFKTAPDGAVWALCSGGQLLAATPGTRPCRQIHGSACTAAPSYLRSRCALLCDGATHWLAVLLTW